MSHDDYRLLIFQVVEHHLKKLEKCQSSEEVDYHAQNIRSAVQYLKRFTIATPVERRPPEGVVSDGRLDHTASKDF